MLQFVCDKMNECDYVCLDCCILHKMPKESGHLRLVKDTAKEV